MDREGRRPSRKTWDFDHDEPLDDGDRSASEKVERTLLQLVLIGLVALVLVQTLHTNRDLAKVLLALDGLEGVDLNTLIMQPQAPPEPVVDRAVPAMERHVRPSITVILVTRRSEPSAVLQIDGVPAGDFRHGSVTVQVEPGREIAVDGRAIKGRLRFRVVAAPGLSEPAWGKEVETEGNRQVLGIARGGRPAR